MSVVEFGMDPMMKPEAVVVDVVHQMPMVDDVVVVVVMAFHL